MDVIAFARVQTVPLIPGVRDWSALEKRREEERNTVGNTESHSDVNVRSKQFVWENREEEPQNGNLEGAHSLEVRDLADEEILSMVQNQIGLKERMNGLTKRKWVI